MRFRLGLDTRLLVSAVCVNTHMNYKNNGGSGSSGSGGLFDEDAMIEDENIYSATTGKLDVGELVAQVFWVNLDPYPKKPGTSPVVYEISG
jgi:hypothetical protein